MKILVIFFTIMLFGMTIFAKESTVVSDELVNFLKGKRPESTKLLQAQPQINVVQSNSVIKNKCNIEIIDAIEKNKISFFSNKSSDELKQINNCLISDRLSPLMMAAYTDKIKIVKIMLKAGIDPNEADDRGYTPLHFAAFYGNYGIVELLLENGANIDAKNNIGQTALMIASYYGNATTVKFLLNKGANKDLKDDSGLTAKELALKKNKREVLEVLK